MGGKEITRLIVKFAMNILVILQGFCPRSMESILKDGASGTVMLVASISR